MCAGQQLEVAAGLRGVTSSRTHADRVLGAQGKAGAKRCNQREPAHDQRCLC